MSVLFNTNRNLISVRFEGVEEIRRRMGAMQNHLRYRMLVDIMKKSLTRALEEARSRAPVGNPVERAPNRRNKAKGRFTSVPGVLRRSFKITKMPNFNPYILEVHLENTCFYAYWVEMGHKIVKSNGKVKRTVGRSPAIPFMRPTFESQKNDIAEQVRKGIWKGLDRRHV